MAYDFGELLRRLRGERGLSQQQLANALHVSRSSVASWEAGRRTPDVAMILDIAKYFKVDVSDLLEESEDDRASPNVLLVDDSVIALRGGADVLGQALPSAHIVALAGAAKALEYARSNPVAIAFLDIELGKNNGIDLCRALLEVQSDLNVVYLTAYTEYSLDAWNTAASGFLLKPLRVESVLEQVARLRHKVRGLP